MPGPSRILEILVWYVESSELREASLTSRLETRLSTFLYCVHVSLVESFLIRPEKGKEFVQVRTFEMAPSSVGFGVVFFVPNRRFILNSRVYHTGA